MSERVEQFSLQRGKDIVIETPEGLIVIQRTPADDRKDGRSNHITIRMPAKMRAYVGSDRAMQHARFLARRDGAIVPKFRSLAPVVGGDGGIVEVAEPMGIFVQTGEQR
ncbi:MAG: hypothetical protein ACKV2Q_36425 [Planctomycetaceae bacterium]